MGAIYKNGIAYGGAPTLAAASGSHINETGTPTVTATTADGVTTFTFDYLKGQAGSLPSDNVTGTGTSGQVAKFDSNHEIVGATLSTSDISNFPASMPASDVYSWAKAETKPSYTADEVSAIATTAKGTANGVAELDANGLVPSAQLPSYVDDVLEYSSESLFPATGETGKIYVDTTTNKTYRWSGSQYVAIGSDLALGETSSTAYRGDRGAELYTAFGGKSVVTTLDTSANIPTAAAVKTYVDNAIQTYITDALSASY